MNGGVTAAFLFELQEKGRKSQKVQEKTHAKIVDLLTKYRYNFTHKLVNMLTNWQYIRVHS